MLQKEQLSKNYESLHPVLFMKLSNSTLQKKNTLFTWIIIIQVYHLQKICYEMKHISLVLSETISKVTQPKYLEIRECIWKRRDYVVVGKWKDKRDILVISTFHKFELTPEANRRGNEKMKPNIVEDYNQFMSVVDRADQLISCNATPKKTVRWYLKFFFDNCLYIYMYSYMIQLIHSVN